MVQRLTHRGPMVTDEVAPHLSRRRCCNDLTQQTRAVEEIVRKWQAIWNILEASCRKPIFTQRTLCQGRPATETCSDPGGFSTSRSPVHLTEWSRATNTQSAELFQEFKVL